MARQSDRRRGKLEDSPAPNKGLIVGIVVGALVFGGTAVVAFALLMFRGGRADASEIRLSPARVETDGNRLIVRVEASNVSNVRIYRVNWVVDCQLEDEHGNIWKQSPGRDSIPPGKSSVLSFSFPVPPPTSKRLTLRRPTRAIHGHGTDDWNPDDWLVSVKR